ncbi:Protein STB2 [Lachancea thermotolerans]
MQNDDPKTPATPRKLAAAHSPMPLSHQSPPAQDVECPPLTAFVFPDMRAVYTMKLHEMPGIAFSEVTLFGFEIYIVEQWILERKHSTIIASYTGNSQDIVHAVEFALPESPYFWPAPFKAYYDELITFSAPKWTDDGTLFVSTSSQIPSALNLLHVECGDLRKIWNVLKVNLDLKRLHCGGRSAMLLCEPSSASCEKFAQLYKVVSPTKMSQDTESISLTHAVVELITLVQISLTYFDLLDLQYRDGILCSFTERAINDWWVLYGSVYLGISRPKHEGTLGPTTVAALLSLVLTVFFKLTVVNCISSKEPFDEEAFHGGIYLFQKKHGLLKSNSTSISVLDPIVLAKLFEVTPKVSNTDFFKIKKVVKSTVQDITGKGNPMQLANGILTTDLDYLAKNVHGSILCFLWRGKNTKQSAQKLSSKRKFANITFNRGDPADEILKSNVYASKRDDEIWEDFDDQNSSNSPRQESHQFDKDSIQRYSPKNEDLREAREVELSRKSDGRVFETELHRRPSVPYLPEDVGMLQMEYENAPRKNNLGNVKTRRRSLSTVQDAIETWANPFDPSLIRLARNALRLEKEISWNQTQRTTKSEKDQLITPHMKRLRKNHSELRSKLQGLKHLRETLNNKHSVVLGDISELDSLGSKLKYDVRILENRMRDVEERVAQFGSKLNSMARSMEDKEACQLITSSFYNNPKKLDRYAREILEGAGRFKSHGVILNLWELTKSMPSPLLAEVQRIWIYLCDRFAPQGHLRK